MALYHKWDVKNGFAYVLTFFSLISDGLGGVFPMINALSNLGPIVFLYYFSLKTKLHKVVSTLIL